MRLSYIVNDGDNLLNIKDILKNRLDLSEKLIKRLKYAGQVLCNSIPVHVNALVNSGDIVEVLIEFDEENDQVIPENIPLDILNEDEAFIAINKPPNIVVHPTFNHPSGTIANGLKYHMLKTSVRSLIRPVSRLDRDTSGVIVFAYNQFVQENLVRQMHSKTFYKEYLGIVHGIVGKKSGKIDLAIERKPESIMLRHVSQSGAPSITYFEVIEYLNKATLLKFVLETGRTHQIRVHCQAIGHPIVGDTLYPSLISPEDDKNQSLISRQALHSHRTIFEHPFTKSLVEVIAPVPKDMLTALEILKK